MLRASPGGHDLACVPSFVTNSDQDELLDRHSRSTRGGEVGFLETSNLIRKLSSWFFELNF